MLRDGYFYKDLHEQECISLCSVVSKESGLTPHYNVVLVGNSNVGKTSFMKRVQSGKFCSDFYASVGKFHLVCIILLSEVYINQRKHAE